MSSKLPILLAIAGVAYFISTASAETGDDISGCMDSAACNYDSTATVDSGDCKYGDACDDDDEPPIPGNLCGNANFIQGEYDANVNLNGEPWGIDSDNRCKIHNIRVSQEDFNIADPQGRTMRVYFTADVYNQSKSRCGQSKYLKRDLKCWFAPTNGTNVGGKDNAGASNNLQFKVTAHPTGNSSSQYSPTTGWVAGDDIFTGYDNNISPTEVEDDLRLLEGAKAKYSVDLELGSSSQLGSYSIIVSSRRKLDPDYGGNFQSWTRAEDIFNVRECDATSEAENYETRFMSNQSFMTL